jgi:hypothetical protein
MDLFSNAALPYMRSDCDVKSLHWT